MQLRKINTTTLYILITVTYHFNLNGTILYSRGAAFPIRMDAASIIRRMLIPSTALL